MRRFLKFFSVQRGTPRESDTASRREEARSLNPCNVVAQWSHHSSSHDSDILLCTQTSWAQVGSHGKQFSSLCTAHIAPVLCRLPRLQKRQRERNGEEKKEKKERQDSAVKTFCTSCCTCQATQLQQQQQQQQERQPQPQRHGRCNEGVCPPRDCR